eukprot:2054412-Ditylum_brightwellii.AAC.1
MLRTPTASLQTGTKPVYVPELHDLPATQITIAPYLYACMSHTSPQKVTQLANACPTNEYVPTHRWNTSPPTLAIVPYASACMTHMSP